MAPLVSLFFLPENASQETPVPVMYWLSGLTCSDENFMQKAGAFKSAAEHGIAIVAADTSQEVMMFPMMRKAHTILA